MRTGMLVRGSGWAAVMTVAFVALAAGRADASCNFVPGSENTFRASLSSLDRPFASPGDPVTIELDLQGCESSLGVGFTEIAPPTGPENDYQVVLVFTPPNGPANAVVLHDQDDPSACVGFEGSALDTACENELPILGEGDAGATRAAICIETRIEITGNSVLEFTFPDTNALAGSSAPPDATLAGPVKIAVQPRGTASLPCSIASNRCADTVGGSDLLACVDELYDVNDTCLTDPLQIEDTYPNFTALPVWNNYEAMCEPSPGSPCDGQSPPARFTIDQSGNLLIPINWGGVLVRLDDGTPVPRLVNLTTGIPAFDGSTETIEVPGPSFSAALSPEGHFLPPIFSPFSEDAENEVVLFGSVDAPFSITRINRRGSAFEWCVGGMNDGRPCNEDGECPDGACQASVCHRAETLGGKPLPLSELSTPEADVPCATDADCAGTDECGPSNFDFASRFSGEGCGPAIDDTYVATAGNLVPLESLFIQQSEDILALPRVEAFEEAEGSLLDADFNQDGDRRDVAMTLVNRQTGNEQQIGIQAPGALGVGATQVVQPPYRFTAIGVEDDILAFLQYEPSDFKNDVNANGRIEDSVLRVYKRAADDDTPNPPINPAATADAGPVIDGLTLAISDGLVFYRSSEADDGPRQTIPASVDENGDVPVDFDSPFSFINHSRGRGTMSSDGRFVVFATEANMLVSAPADTNESSDVYLLDRDADEDGLLDEPGEILVELISVDSNEAIGEERSGARFDEGNAVSDDGRYVAFPSRSVLAPRESSSETNMYLRDRLLGTTTLMSTGPCNPGNDLEGERPSMSEDGAYVAFELDPIEGGLDSICLFDIATGTPELILPGLVGPSFVLVFEDPSLSEDGRYLAFTTNMQLSPSDFDPPGSFTSDDVYILDRETNAIEFASPGGFGASRDPSISKDGKRVAFFTEASLLPEDDDSGGLDVYVYDARTGALQFVDVERIADTDTFARFYEGGDVDDPKLSPDGRYVTYKVGASSDFPESTLLTDLRTETTRWTSVNGAGTVLSPGVELFEMENPAIAERGLHATFTDDFAFLLSDGNGVEDVWVNGIQTGAGVTTGDLLGDGDLDDVLLYVYDARNETTPVALGPASQVSVAGGNAAFLCDQDADRTATGDDTNVCFYTNRSTVQNLGQDAREVKLSEAVLAARALNGLPDPIVKTWEPTSASWTDVADLDGNVQTSDEICGVSGSIVAFTTLEGEQGTDYNGDGDQADRFAQVYDAEAGTLLDVQIGARFCEIGPPSGICVGPAGDACTSDDECQIGAFCDDAGACRILGNACDDDSGCESGESCATGSVIAVATTEFSLCEDSLLCENADTVAFCGCDGNGDGDCCDDDEFLQLAGCEADFVCAAAESLGCECDLNGDGDCCDDVLQAYDTGLDRTVNCGQAMVPCVEEACDPREAVRVDEQLIRFLTVECDQNTLPGIDDEGCGLFISGDLNANGIGGELLVQTCNARTGEVEVVGVVEDGDTEGDPLGGSGGGTAFLGDGECIESTPVACTSTNADCAADEYCDIQTGVCAKHLGSCVTDADCTGCDGEDPCVDPNIECRDSKILAASGDRDGDQVADAFDNCVNDRNTSQANIDEDELGDACDLKTCGNGILEFNEFCDDGNREDGDGCPGDCRQPEVGAVCDVNNDAFIDNSDIQLITNALGQPAFPGDPRDEDGDGTITIFDARACATVCTRPNCKAQGACGLLGIEMLLLAAPLVWRRRRARR